MVGDAHGRPLVFHVTPGEAADCQSYDALSDLPAATPAYFLGDKLTTPMPFALISRRAASVPSFLRSRTASAPSAGTSAATASAACKVGHFKTNRAVATRIDHILVIVDRKLSAATPALSRASGACRPPFCIRV
jgi:hypothetical protein